MRVFNQGKLIDFRKQKPHLPMRSLASNEIITPPIPSQSNLASSWGLFNLNPASYIAGASMYTYPIDEGTSFLPSAPYFSDVADLYSQYPLIRAGILYDQNANINNLIQNNGNKQPQVVLSTDITINFLAPPAGLSDGKYTYRGQFNGWNFYVLEGQSSGSMDNNNVPYSIWGDDFWYINNDEGSAIISSIDSPTTNPIPSNSDWDGVLEATAGIPSSFLQGESGRYLLGTDTALNEFQGSVNLLVYISDLVNPQTIFMTGNSVSSQKEIQIKLISGVLTAIAYDNTAVTPLANTKTKIINSEGWYSIGFTFDTQEGSGAVNQTKLYVNGSTSGVTSPISNSLADDTIGVGFPNFMSDFQGRGLMCSIYTDVKDQTWQTEYHNYMSYLLESIGFSF